MPWETLKGKQLEECVYWLLDAMGAKDLQWRVGGAGEGAADQGRDLEASFYSADPDGEMRRQDWWVEAKGRKTTVEKEAVINAATNALTASEADVLILVTNTRFSNPTLDWVAQWNKKQPKPKVRLWDRTALERHLGTHPQVVARIFPAALSPQGIAESLSSGFWNQNRIGDGTMLKALWHERRAIEWDYRSIVAVFVSEIANGDVTRRAWGAILTNDQLLKAFIIALSNAPVSLVRWHEMGRSFAPYSETLAYFLLNLLSRFDAPFVAKVIDASWTATGKELPEEITAHFVHPMLRRLGAELFDVCQHRCHRINTKPSLLTEKQIESYWHRLRETDDKAEADEQEEIFVIEAKKVKCDVGFKSGCPYFSDEKNKVEQQLADFRSTVLFRMAQFKKQQDDPLRKILGS